MIYLSDIDSWSFAKRYIGTISICNLPKLHTTNVSRMNLMEKKHLHTEIGKK